MQYLTFKYLFIRQNTFFKTILRFILQTTTTIKTVVKKYKSTPQKKSPLSQKGYSSILHKIINYQMSIINRQPTTHQKKEALSTERTSFSILYKIINC